METENKPTCGWCCIFQYISHPPAKERVAGRDRTVPRSANSDTHQYCPASLVESIRMCKVDIRSALDMADLESTKTTSMLSWYHLNVCGDWEDWTVQIRVTCWKSESLFSTICDIGWLLKVISKSPCDCTPAKKDRQNAQQCWAKQSVVSACTCRKDCDAVDAHLLRCRYWTNWSWADA